MFSTLKQDSRKGAYLPDIDPRIALAQRMPVAELGHNRNGIQTRILRESCRYDLKRVRICLEAV